MSDDGRREPATVKRLGYIDWARGLAILIMIEAHVIDAWTGPAGRATPLFRHLMFVAGFAAPLFLFLAGVSVVLAAAARQARREASSSRPPPSAVAGGRSSAWPSSSGSSPFC